MSWYENDANCLENSLPDFQYTYFDKNLLDEMNVVPFDGK